MRPLQAMALGYLLVALYAKVGGYDLYADPLGWLLVLYGVRRLPAELEGRTRLLLVGLVAGAVSVPLWVPTVARWLEGADPALAWAAGLPQLAFAALLCERLAHAASEAGEPAASGWMRTLLSLVVVVAVLPVLVLGAGLDDLAPGTAAAAVLAQLALVWLLFAYSGRSWAGGPAPRPAA